jgi:NAD(P)-dependent dehydrogenase (short-subunit alcohol dehydrogenase family)
VAQVRAELASSGKVESVIVTAGGWAGGGVDADGLESIDGMWQACVQSAAMGSHLAANMLKPEGMLVLTGAGAALGACDGMIGYGMAKAATHHLVKSLSVGSELPEGCTVTRTLVLTRTLALTLAPPPPPGGGHPARRDRHGGQPCRHAGRRLQEVPAPPQPSPDPGP